jgi:hypothetical protein
MATRSRADDVAGARRWGGAAAVVVVLAVFVLPARADYLKPVLPMEEGSVLVYPDLVREGEVPNRDFETMYGPGNLWLLAGIYGAFGTSTTVERTVGLLYRLALVLALFMIGRRWGVGMGLACALIAILMTVGSWAVAYAWFGGLALATWSLWAVTTGRRRPFLGGFLGGLALVFRPDLILAVGALAMWARRWRFVAGVAVGSLPYVILAVLAGPVKVFEGLVVDPLFRINPGRRFPIPWTSPLLWLVVAASCLLLAAGWTDQRRTGERVLLTCAAFSVGLLPYALQRADGFHLASAGCVAVALSPVALRVFLVGRRQLATLVSCLCVVLFAWGTVVRGAFESVGQSFGLGPVPSYRLTFEGRAVPLPLEEQVGELSGVLDRVNDLARPGDRVFVGPDDLAHPVYNDTFLYYLVPRLVPATYYLEMNPGTADRPGSRLRDDVASADVLILTSRFDEWDGSDSSRSSESSFFVGFCPRLSSGPWQVLVRCSDETV